MRIFAKHLHGQDNPLVDAPFWALEQLVVSVLILEMQEKIMAAIDDLAADVAAEDTVIDSAVVLLNGIPALIAAAGVDPAKLANLQADIKAKTAGLAAAVLANTPTPTPPVVVPPVVSQPQANAAATAAVAANPPPA